ncbi:hypothetical protein M3Y99_00825100 [Aphelenchoides fujianensis]|nr:hypothetical protein M3Y99_00825100 [Aphelenchoides fujianensis]
MAVNRVMLVLTLPLVLLVHSTAGFTIPVPFGGIDLTRNPSDGTIDVNAGSNIDVMGWGPNSNFELKGKPGHNIMTGGGLGFKANGQEFGKHSVIGIDKDKGVDQRDDWNLGPKTLHAQLGKEAQFIGDSVGTLTGVIKNPWEVISPFAQGGGARAGPPVVVG